MEPDHRWADWATFVDTLLTFLAGPGARGFHCKNINTRWIDKLWKPLGPGGQDLPTGALRGGSCEDVAALIKLIGKSNHSTAIQARVEGKERPPIACPVCLQEDTEYVFVTACGHPLCLPCTVRCVESDWSTPTIRCPMCRSIAVLDLPEQGLLLGPPVSPDIPMKHGKLAHVYTHIIKNPGHRNVVVVTQHRHMVPMWVRTLSEGFLGQVTHSRQSGVKFCLQTPSLPVIECVDNTIRKGATHTRKHSY